MRRTGKRGDRERTKYFLNEILNVAGAGQTACRGPDLQSFVRLPYDVNPIRFKNPFIPGLRFSVGTGPEVLTRHERRHLLQAERIRESPEFPAA